MNLVVSTSIFALLTFVNVCGMHKVAQITGIKEAWRIGQQRNTYVNRAPLFHRKIDTFSYVKNERKDINTNAVFCRRSSTLSRLVAMSQNDLEKMASKKLQDDENAYAQWQLTSSLHKDEVITPYWEKIAHLPVEERQAEFKKKIVDTWDAFASSRLYPIFRVNIAAAIHAEINLSKFPDFIGSFLDAAVYNEDIPLVEMLVENGACKILKEDVESRIFNSMTHKPLKITQILLEGGFKLPNDALLGKALWHPQFISLFRKYGADPLRPNDIRPVNYKKDAMCPAITDSKGVIIARLAIAVPVFYYNPLGHMVDTIQSFTSEEVRSSFEALTKGLNKHEIMQMITYDSEERGHDLRQELKNKKEASAAALLQCMEQKLKE